MSSSTASLRPTMIIGCGYLGRRVALRWRSRGKRVLALTRSRSQELESLGVEPILGDVLHPDSLASVPAVSTLLYAVGYDRQSGAAMRDVYVHGVVNVLSQVPPPERIIYISSTSVYGQNDGSEVDEQSCCDPIESSGKVVKDAEQALKSVRPDATILRFVGIYGPNRLLRKQAILNGEPLIGDAEKWLNLIHVEDGADAVVAASEKSSAGECFNISDGTPVRRRDYYSHLSTLLGAPPAKFEPHPDPSQAPPETNRRIRNAKALKQLGWTPRYPSYLQGLAAAVAESD